MAQVRPAPKVRQAAARGHSLTHQYRKPLLTSKQSRANASQQPYVSISQPVPLRRADGVRRKSPVQPRPTSSLYSRSSREERSDNPASFHAITTSVPVYVQSPTRKLPSPEQSTSNRSSVSAYFALEAVNSDRDNPDWPDRRTRRHDTIIAKSPITWPTLISRIGRARRF